LVAHGLSRRGNIHGTGEESLDCWADRLYFYGESLVQQLRAIVRILFRSEQSDGMSGIVEGKPAGMPKSQRRWWLAIFLAAGLVWGGWVWWTDRNYRDAIVQIELEMANGRFGTAARSLTKLLARWPDCDEAALLLARCEQERGRNDAAAKALARVDPRSVFSHKAILARMRLAHDKGQLAVAEQIVNAAAADPRNDRSHTRFLLVPIYSQLGRLDEAERLIEERWEHLNEKGHGASEPAIDLVRMHIQLTFKPNPVKDVGAYLETAASLGPDDDRVWLGRANLAIRTGDIAEARRWLEACRRRRPDDIAVWASWLRLGIAADQVEVVHEALGHLPAEASTPAQLDRLKAWLAARRGDVKSERRELEALNAADPGDLTALDRLVQLAEQAGEPARAGDLQRKRAEIGRLRVRYARLYDRTQPIRDAVEMAEIAEQLGRTFEARVFLTLALAEDPERLDLRHALMRLSQGPARSTHRGKTLAELIADEQASDGQSDASTSR
jgi:enediyne biosynthesis protein E4